MVYDFPKAHDAHIQLLYDRHNSLYHSRAQLTEHITARGENDTESLLDAVINSRPTSNSTAFELLKHQYNGLRLQTLLGLADPNGIFRTVVPYDSELMEELVNHGNWCIRVSKAGKTMGISTVPF